MWSPKEPSFFKNDFLDASGYQALSYPALCITLPAETLGVVMRLKKRQSFSSSLLACTLSNVSLRFRVTLGLIFIIFSEKHNSWVCPSVHQISLALDLTICVCFMLLCVFFPHKAPLSRSQQWLYLNCTDGTLFAGHTESVFLSLTPSKTLSRRSREGKRWMTYSVGNSAFFPLAG